MDILAAQSPPQNVQLAERLKDERLMPPLARDIPADVHAFVGCIAKARSRCTVRSGSRGVSVRSSSAIVSVACGLANARRTALGAKVAANRPAMS